MGSDAGEAYLQEDSFKINKHISVIMGVFVSFLIGCTANVSTGGKAHHTQDGYRNIHLPQEGRFWDFLKWRWSRLFKELPDESVYHFSMAENDPMYLASNRSRNTLTWIGHATLLVQLEGKNILTDPVFSLRASPVQWAGPKRLVPPGIALKDLPPIDIVVISHSHYDALDKETILRLLQHKRGEEILFLVPLGLKSWFARLGARRVIELDWWDEHDASGLKLVAVPVQHWSKRSVFSRNDTLWAGWVIMGEQYRIFFAGDSGYAPHFKMIGDRLGPFDLAAIPIGAYEPRWFMRNHHMNPEEAIQVHLDLRSRRSLGIHWGTFILTDEPPDEPPVRLTKGLQSRGISLNDFIVLRHGETIFLK